MGKVGGDAVLSTRGERYAQALATKFNAMRIPDLRVLTSRLRRTIATARGVEAPQEHVAALNELHAGICEGLSYEEMQEHYPQVIRDLKRVSRHSETFLQFILMQISLALMKTENISLIFGLTFSVSLFHFTQLKHIFHI